MRTQQQNSDERMEALENLGVELWPAIRVENIPINQLPENDTGETNEEPEQDREFLIAGRIVSIRDHGNIAFIDLRDGSGEIQIVFRDENFNEQENSIISLLSRGDFISVTGSLGETRTGERSIFASEFQFLSFALNQFPEQLTNPQTRYSQRALDMIVNENVRETIRTRTQINTIMRDYLNNRDFLEIETPILQPIYGGSNARPFVTHHNALGRDVYLRISNELYLKRLIIGGFDRVYEFSRDFRNEGMDHSHNPEFTQIEIYQAYADYTDMMDLMEELIERIAIEVTGSSQVEYQGQTLDFTRPWRRLSMADSLREFADINVDELSDEQLTNLCRANEIETETLNRGLMIAELFDELVEEHLIQPIFITDMPRETTSLCKLHRENPDLIERFECFANASEICNAYTELNNPLLQREFLQEQVERQEMGDEEAHPMDENFIQAMEYGMPPTGGIGIGIDRLNMLMTNHEHIREVQSFGIQRG
jgi:lysyl-tRNA synthetase class 2